MDKATQAEIDLGRERLKMHEQRAQDARDTDAANKKLGEQLPDFDAGFGVGAKGEAPFAGGNPVGFAKDYAADTNIVAGGVLAVDPTPSFIRLESENEEEAEARKNAELAKAEAEAKEAKPAKKKEEPAKKKEEPAKSDGAGENLLDDLLNS